MKRLFIIFFAMTLFHTNLHPRQVDAAVMEDYCVVPPYVIQNVPPNVMIILDNSGSMLILLIPTVLRQLLQAMIIPAPTAEVPVPASRIPAHIHPPVLLTPQILMLITNTMVILTLTTGIPIHLIDLYLLLQK